MSWLLVDDGMGEHVKADLAGHAALGLWLILACYCARNLTDGYVSKARAEQYGTPEEVRSLVKSGLLDRAKGGYQLHDYLDWNKSKETIDAERAAARERMKRVRGSSAEQAPNNQRSSLSPSSSSFRTTRSPRRKGAAGSETNDNPAEIPVCPIHQQQGVVCIGCAADKKAGGAA